MNPSGSNIRKESCKTSLLVMKGVSVEMLIEAREYLNECSIVVQES